MKERIKWNLLNTEIRGKANMQRSLCTNPLEFDLEKSRADINAALHRPTQKLGKENMNAKAHDIRTGLTHENNKKCTVSLSKKATKFCAVCGVTAALRLCSVCGSIAYCCREHQVDHWRTHKTDCKRIQKSKQKRGK